jgi:rhodanese-related sulfurtransferase
MTACFAGVIERVQVQRDAPRQAADWIGRGAFILDVSPSEFFAAGHIAGAVSIPKGQLFHRTDEVPYDKDFVILVYDTRGVRSSAAAMLLKDEGYNHVHELTGGLNAWRAEGLPVEGGQFPSAL